MIYLLLSIISSTGIFIIFKYLDYKKLPSFPIIVINYLIAAILGFIIAPSAKNMREIFFEPWIPISILIGFLFIVLFFIVAKSSGEAGISITTVASKMSVVFPITFSILINDHDKLSFVKAFAIIATLSGVLLTIYKPGKLVKNASRFYIPIILFVGMGVVDSLVKYAQHTYINNGETAIFSAVLFTMAFFTGIVILPFRKEGISEFRSFAVWKTGSLLGLVNFGSIYLFVSALNYVNEHGNNIDSSIIFGANNIGIVSFSVLTGLLFFKERLLNINWLGIGISFIAIILFSIS